MQPSRFAIALIAATALGVAVAEAGIVTVNFSGPVLSSSGSLATAATMGSGTLTYDDSVADSDPDPNRGRYVQSGHTFSVTAGSFSASLPLHDVRVFRLPDQLQIVFDSANQNGFAQGIGMRLFLFDSLLVGDNIPLVGDELPTFNPLPRVDSGLALVFDPTGRGSVNGHLQVIIPVPDAVVPAPATLGLLGAALALFGTARRRSRVSD
jgi:hypothetical protein